MSKPIRIGTRDSQLAVWQASLVQRQLLDKGIASELVLIKSDGDIDLVTPLYELGVQGIFTRTLDAALLSDLIDIAVHSMKDVPTRLAIGIEQAAVLPRASYKDILVYKGEKGRLEKALGIQEEKWFDDFLTQPFFQNTSLLIATSSNRRKAQWLNRYPGHRIDNLRGNVNTRLRKVAESDWDGAIFAAAGLERINLRPENSLELDWMLPAPAQGAIMIVCRETDLDLKKQCSILNDETTALCTLVERDFLRGLFGGCSTPISALAELHNGLITLKGNILSPDGIEKMDLEITTPVQDCEKMGEQAANTLLMRGADKIVKAIRDAN